ncbi:MAG: HAMP domain-containing histidine kinase [Clostridiales bacterium]|jgi:signal transduction histidine kinase|nr:HAMP domain-containing histidine kinase [Clostridiales bacterium]
MKFWQKAFFITLILFLIAFDSLGYILLERSFSLNRENAIQAAQSEHRIIARSVYERINYSSGLYTELNADNLKGIVAPYASYYSGQGGYIALYQNGNIVFNSSAVFSPPSAQGEEARTDEVEDVLYCVIGNDLPQPLENLRLIYMKDASALRDFKSSMTHSFIVISIVISLILSITLLFLLVRLTGPFRVLNAAAVSIAQGDYGNRAPVAGGDEIGQFAHSFNVMADKVQKHVEELSNVSESKERFINNLAHETRTPITAIVGYAELLKIGNISSEEREKAINYIIGQSRRIQNMACKLNELARMSHGSIEKKTVNIGKIFSNVCATCKTQLEEKHIALSQEIGSAAIMGDAELMESLLQNLIENAVKASVDGGKIDVQVYSENNETIIAVTDCGKGMEKREISKITEPFYRADKSRSRADGGAGLGLAICARICETHNARLEIESELGTGTKIKIHFTTP